MKIYSYQILNIYKEQIVQFSEEFSISTDFVQIPKELTKKIEEYKKILPKHYKHYKRVNFDEPFRIFLSLVFHRLDNFQKTRKVINIFMNFLMIFYYFKIVFKNIWNKNPKYKIR